jgi:hypothetical protein
MKFRNVYLAVALLATSFSFTACNDDDEWNTKGDGNVEFTTSARAFILNEGNMGSNNSNIIYFDWSTGTVNANDLFMAQNGKKLGDTGNDIITVGNNRLVVAVNVSNYVTLLDGYGMEKSRVSFEPYKNLGQVRSVDEKDGIIYATSYGGYVSRLRIQDDKLVYMDSLRVGDRPEDIAELNGKLYVTLQGQNYDDNRLAIVGRDFQTINYVTIMQNPTKVYEDNGKIYVTGYGDQSDNPWGVYDPSTGTYTELGHASAVGMGGNVIYTAYSVTDWTTYTTTTTLGAYNVKTGETNASFFKNAPAELATANIYSVSVNSYSKKVYLATSASDYVSDGSVYVFDAQGNYETKFSSYGANPHAIVFLK